MLISKYLSSSILKLYRLQIYLKMILLRPAFKKVGKNFIFDPNGFYSFKNIQAGDDVSIGRGALFLASESSIIIGNKVMFGPNVSIIGGNHNTSTIGKFMYDIKEKRNCDDKDIIVDDDVWIGTGAIILKGVILGRGSIIAAGSLVNNDVLPYTVVGGVPAKLLSYRFKNSKTILQHEEKLYPMDKRLNAEFLKYIFCENNFK